MWFQDAVCWDAQPQRQSFTQNCEISHSTCRPGRKHNCWNWVDEDITPFVVPRFQEVIYSLLGKQWESLRHLPWQIASYDTNLWWQQAGFYGSRVVLNFVHKAWDETEGYSTASLNTVIKEHAHNCAVWRSETVPERQVPVTASMCRWRSETGLSEGKKVSTGKRDRMHEWGLSLCHCW